MSPRLDQALHERGLVRSRNQGREFILAGSPWAALWPSLAIASLVVGLNLLADGQGTKN